MLSKTTLAVVAAALLGFASWAIAAPKYQAHHAKADNVQTLRATASSLAFAQSLDGGQYPAPPALANRMALPECGFAATESWGPNGFQYCDSRNVYSSVKSYGYGGRQHP